MSLSDPEGNVEIDCEETCCGRILETARGRGGFGYDPLFEIPEYHATFGEMGRSVKAMLSHRSRAMRRFVPELVKVARSKAYRKRQAKRPTWLGHLAAVVCSQRLELLTPYRGWKRF